MTKDYARYYRYQVPSQRPRRIQEISRVLTGAAIICGIIFALQAYAGNFSASPKIEAGTEQASHVDTKYQVDLTDAATANVAAQVKRWYSNMTASVTGYSLQESCHNRKNGVCIAANGKAPRQGITVACPRSVPLGTRVTIPGMGEYTCQDRTARWIEEKYGPTFDIFMKDHGAALDFGRKKLAVTIVYYTQ